MGCIHRASTWTGMLSRSVPQPWPKCPWIMCRGKVVHSRSCAADREAHRSLAAALIGDVLGLAHFSVANDDDDTADQSCRWGQRRLTQLDAPADALDQSQSVRGLNKSLATQ